MHEFDRLTERVIAQSAEQSDDHRKDDQESVFTEAKRTLQGVQGAAQPLEQDVYPGRHWHYQFPAGSGAPWVPQPALEKKMNRTTSLRSERINFRRLATKTANE
jgi:hypothetical protein